MKLLVSWNAIIDFYNWLTKIMEKGFSKLKVSLNSVWVIWISIIITIKNIGTSDKGFGIFSYKLIDFNLLK